VFVLIHKRDVKGVRASQNRTRITQFERIPTHRRALKGNLFVLFRILGMFGGGKILFVLREINPILEV
jgi:hypothetical protein